MPKKKTTKKKIAPKKAAQSAKVGMKGLWSTFAIIIITAIVAGGAVYFLQTSTLQEEQEQNKILKTGSQSQIENLQSQIEQLRQDKEDLGTLLSLAPSAKPFEGWDQYFPATGDSVIKGELNLNVRSLLGNPELLIRQGDKEVWVFHPYDQDSTGLYLFFENGKLINSKLDEFNGFGNDLIDNEANWEE